MGPVRPNPPHGTQCAVPPLGGATVWGWAVGDVVGGAITVVGLVGGVVELPNVGAVKSIQLPACH
jgi:hypothetical protein